MRGAVTFFGLSALILVAGTVGCADRGQRPSECPAVSASVIESDAKVVAWRARLPSIFKFSFERSADGAIMATPECVKTPAQGADFAKYVRVSGFLIPSETISTDFEYLFTPTVPRVMSVTLVRDGTVWLGSQSEQSLIGNLGLRGGDLSIPSCTADQIGEPDQIRTLGSGGNSVRASSLTQHSAGECR